MVNVANLILYVVVGLVGGFLGVKLKIPAGSMVGAMLAIIIVKIILKSEWALPKNIIFLLQVAIGIMVGTTFKPSLLPVFQKIAIPVVASTVILIATGILIAVVFSKLGVLDMTTGYLGTSPGAMTVLVALSFEHNVNAMVVTSFHLFRVIFVVLSVPFISKFIVH